MSIVLVRHTHPDVEGDVCYGRTDLDLAASFPDEALAVIATLQGCDVLITSPLQRCRMLATEIGSEFGVEPRIDDRVQEMDFGAWEGLRWSGIPGSELDQWAQDFLHARPHGGESVAMLRERSLAAIADYRKNPLRHIIVTHAGVIKAVLADGDGPEDFAASIGFGGAVELPRHQE
jgi:alpha-ribazole phosphatase